MRRIFSEKLMILEQKTGEFLDLVRLLKNDSEKLSIQDACERILKINALNRSISKSMHEAESILPMQCPSEYNPYAEPVFSLYKEDGIYHIVMDELLPHRIYVVGDKVQNNYDRDAYYSGYKNSIEQHRSEIDMFNEKILIWILNIYNPNDACADLDNLDQKLFVDTVITGHFVPDDNPAWISYYISAAEGSKTHTEFYIGSVPDMLYFIEKR